MHNFAVTGPCVATPVGDSRQLIAANLRNLIAQIESSVRLIETAMTQEAEADQPGSIDVIVLDDVTPRYAMANAALSACRAGLDLALKSISEFSEPETSAAHRPHLIA